MSKSKEEQARREGMSYALRYAREHGLDALEIDLKKRGAYNIPVWIDDKALQEFTDNAKNMVLDTILILASVTLHDEFGFGKQRLERTLQRFNAKVDALEYEPNKADGITYETLKEDLKNETGFTFTIQRENKSMHGLQK